MEAAGQGVMANVSEATSAITAPRGVSRLGKGGALYFVHSARRFNAVAQYLAIVAIFVYFVYRGGEALNYNWQWARLPKYLVEFGDGHLVWGTLARGLVETIHISAYGFVLALTIAVVTALLRLSDSLAGRWIARFYVEAIRNTPLLVQINIFYFVIAPIVGVDRFWAGVLCLSLFEGAFTSEILRSGILAIEAGQWEASAALGLGRLATYRLIVLPQAIRMMLPPLVGVAVSLIKDSSIVSVIALFELTTAGRDVVAQTFMSFEIWFVVAAIYLGLTVPLSLTVYFIERRLKRR